MTPPTIIALDLSLKSTGIAGNAGGGWARTIQPTKTDIHERLSYIRRAIFSHYLNGKTNPYVVIEGPSFNSKFGNPHERGGLWWMVADKLYQREIPYAVVPPKSLKMFATGKGNADKAAVMEAARDRMSWVPQQNDAADAAVLCAMAAEHLGCPLGARFPWTTSALRGCQWPTYTPGIDL